jgi:hypothetical protein
VITMKATNVSVRAVFLNPGFPHLDVRVVLPQKYINATPNACGLLGTPDNRPSNDWLTSDCTRILDLPTSHEQLFNREAYEYCTSTWCVRNASNSLFPYNNETFDSFSGCDAPYPGPVDVSQASPELKALCGIDIPCLMDGIEIGIAGAQSLLNSESLIGRGSFLQANPATIQVQISFNVEITIDISRVGNLPGTLESFQLFRVNSENRQVGTVSVVSLLDVGSGIGRDTAANDGIFSNVLAIRSDTPGEWLGFRAVPVFDGVPDPDSSLAFESLNTVRSYSPASGVGENITLGENVTSGTLTAANVSDLVVVIEYAWPRDQADLDTGTMFLGRTVGYCDSTLKPYMEWTGDDTGFGGLERVVVNLGEAFNAGEWAGATTIVLNSAWYPSVSSGPATISVHVQVGTVVTFAFDPGLSADDSCTTKVGQLDVTVTAAGGAIVDIKKSVSP